jgi:hypothetical protein
MTAKMAVVITILPELGLHSPLKNWLSLAGRPWFVIVGDVNEAKMSAVAIPTIKRLV